MPKPPPPPPPAPRAPRARTSTRGRPPCVRRARRARMPSKVTDQSSFRPHIVRILRTEGSLETEDMLLELEMAMEDELRERDRQPTPDRRGPLAPVRPVGAEGDDRRGADGRRQAGSLGAHRGGARGRLLTDRGSPGRHARPIDLDLVAQRRAELAARGRRRTRTCRGRSSSRAASRRAAPSRCTPRRRPRRSRPARRAPGRCSRPRATRPSRPTVDGNGSPSIRAIVVSSASSIAGVTSTESWRSHPRCS